MTPGAHLDLDSLAADWNRRFTPPAAPDDLVFAAGRRALMSDQLPADSPSTPARNMDCTARSPGPVLTSVDLRPGVGMCVPTRAGREALVTITAVHRDETGAPDRLVLDITVWDNHNLSESPVTVAHPSSRPTTREPGTDRAPTASPATSST
jgi:hypothetical protein